MSDVTVNLIQENITVEFPFSLPGPEGPAGPEGGSTVVYEAGEDLSSGRAVVIDGGEAIYFQPADATHAGRCFGVTVTSGSAGQDVEIQLSGELEDAAFSFSGEGPVWAGEDGELFETPPGSGLVQQVGASTAADTIRINIQATTIRT